MNLADAYNKLKLDNKPQPKSNLALKTNPTVISVFKQAVCLIENDIWIKGCPQEIKKEDYYFYLKFNNESDCVRAIKSKRKQPIFSVERIVSRNDVFQYRNRNGEMDIDIRPLESNNFYGLEFSDCYDDKAALSKFLKVMPDENYVMKNLCGEQEHVFLGFSCSINYDKQFTIVLFKDGNAYYFEAPYVGMINKNPYLSVIELDNMLGRLKEESLLNDMAHSIDSCNKWKSLVEIGAPIKKMNYNFFIDYFVFNRKSYPSIYQTPEKKRQEYQSKGNCSYCGGSFEGSFIKKCEICGRKKDY